MAVACGEAEPPRDPFGTIQSFPLGAAARAVAVSNEAESEVALAFPQDDVVGLLETRGGVLRATAVEVGRDPLALAAFDGDGDGARELATANAGDGTVSLVGPEGVGLSVLATAALDSAPKHVARGDLDADGRDDLVITLGVHDAASSSVEVWARAPEGLARRGPGWSLPGAFATTAGDLDADGDDDVVAVVQLTDEIAWAAEGANGLEPVGRAAACETPRAAVVFAGGVVVGCADGLAWVEPSSAETIALPWEGNAYDLATGDFDGDGALDLAVADLAHDAVAVWLDPVGRGWSSPSEHPVGADPIALVAADLAADGDLDLIVSAFGSRALDVLENLRVSDERTLP
jgi:hypothetical protein